MFASPTYHPAPRGLLSSHAGLPEVEDLMLRLALGERLDIAGEMVGECLRSGGKRFRAHLALAAGHDHDLERPVPSELSCLHHSGHRVTTGATSGLS